MGALAKALHSTHPIRQGNRDAAMGQIVMW
jgi:hypothetical protein